MARGKWVGDTWYSNKALKQGHGRKKSNRKPRTTMGKMFRTKRGKYGCYKYVNGKRVAFVTKRRSRR